MSSNIGLDYCIECYRCDKRLFCTCLYFITILKNTKITGVKINGFSKIYSTTRDAFFSENQPTNSNQTQINIYFPSRLCFVKALTQIESIESIISSLFYSVDNEFYTLNQSNLFVKPLKKKWYHFKDDAFFCLERRVC